MNRITPTYFVQHPNNSYSEASPQPYCDKEEWMELHTINTELLEALEMFMNAGIGNSTGFGAQYDAFEKAKAAITKAKGEPNK